MASIRSNERLTPFASSLASEHAVNQLEIHKQGTGSILENTFADVLMLLDLPHFWIDALVHMVVLIHAHAEKTKRRKALFGAERKCAFFATYFRKMEAEPFWLLHKELETVIKVQAQKPRRNAGKRIEEITWKYLLKKQCSRTLLKETGGDVTNAHIIALCIGLYGF